MSCPVLILTDRRQADRPLVPVIVDCVEAGARAVVLREKDLPRAERYALAEALRAVLEPAGGRLIVAGPDPLGGDAIHLAEADPPAPPGVSLVGRSAHQLSTSDSVDYLTISPIFPTESKPGYGPPLGIARLKDFCAGTPARVFALGGVTSPAQAAACVAAGAAGVAVMGAVMRAADPGAVVADLLSVITAGGADRQGR